jgi:U3 small nucleolar ribonucleoprotein protein IMP4
MQREFDEMQACRGKPDGLVVCHLPFGPTAYFGLHNTVTRHDVGSKGDVGTMSEAKPNLIFENFSTPLGQRFATILKALFPVPKPTTKRVVTFANRNDYISLRCATVITIASTLSLGSNSL